MKKALLVLLVLIWFAIVVFIIQKYISTPGNIPPTLTQLVVKRVIDGDTIELATGEKVRYIGINTPETVDPRKPVQCFGLEAKAENQKLLEGKKVTLEKDVSDKDKYGRLLRYVYIDNLFVNDYLVKNGFAQVSTFPPDVKYQDLFLASQEEAKNNSVGLWSKCPRKK